MSKKGTISFYPSVFPSTDRSNSSAETVVPTALCNGAGNGRSRASFPVWLWVRVCKVRQSQELWVTIIISYSDEAEAGQMTDRHTHCRWEVLRGQNVLLKTMCGIRACRCCDGQWELLETRYHQKSTPPVLQTWDSPLEPPQQSSVTRASGQAPKHQYQIIRLSFPDHHTPSLSKDCTSL